MSKIISLIGQRFVFSNRLTGSISCHVYQTSRLSSATFQHNINQCTSEIRTQTSSKKNALFLPRRLLYSAQSLGIRSLENHKANKSQLYERDRDGYVSRMNKYLEDSATQSILLEDLINMIGLAETEEHLDLIERMAVNLNCTQKVSISGWGTAVMRLYYTMNQIDRAYNNIKDSKFGDFFSSYSTFRIAMTLLFNHGQHDQVVDLYNDAVTKVKTGQQARPKNYSGLAVLALASLAKQEDSSAVDKALSIFGDICEDDCNKYMRLRLTTFMSYIAINHNQPIVAMNLISESPAKNYISLRELKALALLKLKRYEDVLYHIRESLVRGSQDQGARRALLHLDTYEAIKNAEEDIKDEAIKHELLETLDELKRSQLVQEALRNNLRNNRVGSKLVSNSYNNNLLPSAQNVVCKRWSGHNAMDIHPSNYGWKHFKDMCHLYAMLAGIPMLVISAITGIRGNPELTEIPEGYEPRHWEYFKHPLTRWIARYIYHPSELDSECFLSYFEMESETSILKKIDNKVTHTMEFYADHRSHNFRPVYGEYFRAGRDDAMYGNVFGLANESTIYEAAFDPKVGAVPVEGYIPSELPPAPGESQ